MDTNDSAATDTFAEALAHIKAQGWANPQQLATWAGVHVASVYNWLAATASPNIEAPRLIVQNCGESLHANKIRLLIGAWLYAGTSIVCRATTHREVKPDPQAIMSGLIESIHELADFANKTKVALVDGVVCMADRTLLQAEAEEAKACIESVLHAINSMPHPPGRIPNLAIAK